MTIRRVARMTKGRWLPTSPSERVKTRRISLHEADVLPVRRAQPERAVVGDRALHGPLIRPLVERNDLYVGPDLLLGLQHVVVALRLIHLGRDLLDQRVDVGVVVAGVVRAGLRVEELVQRGVGELRAHPRERDRLERALRQRRAEVLRRDRDDRDLDPRILQLRLERLALVLGDLDPGDRGERDLQRLAALRAEAVTADRPARSIEPVSYTHLTL